MYCRNCGNHMDDLAAICVKCGVPAGAGNNFCNHCGAQSSAQSAVCMQCGVPFPIPVPQGQRKSKIAAGLLGILLGGLGIHNFYLGYTGRALAQLLISVLSLGFLAFASVIWGLIEGILILTGSITTDANGVPLGE